MTYKQISYYLNFLLLVLLPLIIINIIYYKFWLIVILFLFLIILIIYKIRISKIKETTLCLIVKDNKVLMMLRNKKVNDVHKDKYNGLGGSVEKGESHKTCILREVNEEAGIKLTRYNYIGKVVFKNFGYEKGKEIMYCYVGFEYENEIGDCNEGELMWIAKDEILNLPLWEGDQYFLMNIVNNVPFKGFLHYDNDRVVNHQIKINKQK